MRERKSGPEDGIAGDGEHRPNIRVNARSTTEWEVGRADEFDEKGDNRRILRINGRDVIVFRRGDRYYALDDDCLHMGGSFDEGVLVEAVIDDDRRYPGERFSAKETHIVCPSHGYKYDIETGEYAGDPKVHLRTYPTIERDGLIYVLD